MIEAVIVSTARTAVGKAYRGALNNTEGPTMAGHVIAEAVKRANIAPDEVEDVVLGCAMQQGTMVMNVARKGAIRAGLPITMAGTTIDRQCASGLQAIAVAARSVMLDGVDIAIGGGIESISLVQNEHMNLFHAVDDELMAMKSEMYMSMLETAEVVAERYKIGRDRQDEYSLECQRRVGAALQGGRFKDEIVPITTKMAVVDKATNEVSYKAVTLSQDEGPRPDTTAAGLASIKPVFEGRLRRPCRCLCQQERSRVLKRHGRPPRRTAGLRSSRRRHAGDRHRATGRTRTATTPNVRGPWAERSIAGPLRKQTRPRPVRAAGRSRRGTRWRDGSAAALESTSRGRRQT